ncbi:MAG: hypothetical protein O2U61_00550 [Candidatus Bathyarchaeota archaeon]|nr:hypothetical protein [Candidatus Bathyarchaeota archaeon]MCZ2844984.1 hypothetical protein [Candidatus Bathyarchaeota archaeon]
MLCELVGHKTRRTIEFKGDEPFDANYCTRCGSVFEKENPSELKKILRYVHIL